MSALVSIHTLHPASRCHDSDLKFLIALPAIVSPLSSPSAIGGWTSTSVHHEEYILHCSWWEPSLEWTDWAFGLELHGRRKAPQHRKEILGILRDGRDIDASPLSSPPLAPHSLRYCLQYPLLTSCYFCDLLFECVSSSLLSPLNWRSIMSATRCMVVVIFEEVE